MKYAVMSVSDKRGLSELGRALNQYAINILSTGGTLKSLQEDNIAATQVSTFTDAPEIMDGRVKTLHPKVFANILQRRNEPEDIRQMLQAGYGQDGIDFVIVNLYPFQKTVAKPGVTEAEAIENIDIGGPSMVRAAAKNFAWVCVIVDPNDYPLLIEELAAHDGTTTLEFRKRMAIKAFAHTRDYDTAISTYFADRDTNDQFPEKLHQTFTRQSKKLRYAENPHQQGAAYRDDNFTGVTVLDAEILADNKEISYNNISDLDATLDLLLEFSSRPFACLLKHTNPCGAATGDTLLEAYQSALATDPLSAFGCIIGLNRDVDLACAEVVNKTEFVECILAPGYSPEALALLRKKKQRRILALPGIAAGWPNGELMHRFIRGGLLRQQMNDHAIDPNTLTVVTKRKPTEAELNSLLFAWKVAKHVKSNAIVIAQGTATVGVGMGQTSRVDSAHMALKHAGSRANGAVCASDAFFPKPDGMEIQIQAGVCAFIQPGGSKLDEVAIATADAADAAMVFTGHRCFKH